MKSSNTPTLEKILSYFGFVPKEYYDYEQSRNNKCVAEIAKLKSELSELVEFKESLSRDVAEQKNEQLALIDAYENQIQELRIRLEETATELINTKNSLVASQDKCVDLEDRLHEKTQTVISRDSELNQIAQQLKDERKQHAVNKGLVTRYKNLLKKAEDDFNKKEATTSQSRNS